MPYKSLAQANAAIRGIKPPVNLDQANQIARMADALTANGNKNAWPIAIAAFKKNHQVKNGKWVTVKGVNMQSNKALKPSDYLVVEDQKKSSTWHLPIAKVSGKPDRALAGAAWAALFSPGGHRGQPYTGPRKAEAQKKLKALYKRMKWPEPSSNSKELGFEERAARIRQAWRDAWMEAHREMMEQMQMHGDMEAYHCPYVREVYENYIIVCTKDKMFRVGYTENDDGIVFGDSVEVEVTYTPVKAGVKAFEHDGNKYLVLWTSNAFRDREGEIISTKALEDYSARRDLTGHFDRVWFWHVKGSDFGSVVWQGVVGRILVEVAKVDDTERGAKMFNAILNPDPVIAPMGWGTSHGYLYSAKDRDDKVYEFIEKYETTVLPLHAAANIYGSVKEAIVKTPSRLSAEALKAILGDEADRILSEAKAASDELELSVDFKQDKDEETAKPEDKPAPKPDDEGEEAAEEVQEGERALEFELDTAASKEIANAVLQSPQFLTAIKAVFEQVVGDIEQVIDDRVGAAINGKKEVIVQKALTGKIKLMPYAATRDTRSVTKGVETESKENNGGDGKLPTDDGGVALISGLTKRMLAGN